MGAIATTALSQSRILGANERIRLGLIGCGGRGSQDWESFLDQPDVDPVAACDVYEPFLNRAIATSKGRAKGFHDFRRLLEQKDIDAVIVATPDHWHALMTVAACDAGKDVYCEKPLSLMLSEGRYMVNAARRNKRVVQAGSQQRSAPHYIQAVKLIHDGGIGEVHRIHAGYQRNAVPGFTAKEILTNTPPATLDWEMWLGPAPYAPYTKDRVHFNFRWIWDYSGGIICDWGAHLFDTAQWANDTERTGPIEVEGTGTFWQGGLYNTVKEYDVRYRYKNGVVMTCTPGNPSIKFIGTEGWVGNSGWRGNVQASSDKILNSVIGPEEIHLYTNPEGEHDDFLKCVKSRNDPYFPVDIGHRVSTVCHLANIAIKTGRKLKWNPESEQFDSDDEANAMLSRPMRSPWKLS